MKFVGDMKIIIAYSAKCKEHNWIPSWKGLQAFQKQVYLGIRNNKTYSAEFRTATDKFLKGAV